MNTDETIEYYVTFSGSIIAFTGKGGCDGVLVYNPAQGWIAHGAGSLMWDQFHQEVYRNFRAEQLNEDQLKGRNIPLATPDREAIPATPSWKSNFLWEVKCSDVPPEILSRVKARMPLKTEVHLVLMEDKYETSFGDGKYLYPEVAFWSEAEAKEFILERVRTEPDSAKREWYEYSVRSVLLWTDEDLVNLRADSDIQPYERFSLPDVLKVLTS